uniref:Sorbitol dehydrogenase n=1 Tax=Parascaris equorum TaxID=6256 RepID=A0A914S9D2_PAREQ
MVSGKNLCTVLYAKNDIRMEERAMPVPKPNQLLIRVHTVGICGSDVHYWTHGAIGSFVVRQPMVLGHETSGTVAAMGSEVKGFKVGRFIRNLFFLKWCVLIRCKILLDELVGHSQEIFL